MFTNIYENFQNIFVGKSCILSKNNDAYPFNCSNCEWNSEDL